MDLGIQRSIEVFDEKGISGYKSRERRGGKVEVVLQLVYCRTVSDGQWCSGDMGIGVEILLRWGLGMGEYGCRGGCL